MQKTVQRTGYISGDNLKPEIIGEGASQKKIADAGKANAQVLTEAEYNTLLSKKKK